jgi:hypothetical protein
VVVVVVIGAAVVVAAVGTVVAVVAVAMFVLVVIAILQIYFIFLEQLIAFHVAGFRMRTGLSIATQAACTPAVVKRLNVLTSLIHNQYAPCAIEMYIPR